MSRRILLAGVVVFGWTMHLAAADVASLIGQIKAVGKEGKGNVQAAKAWRELAQQGPEALTQILAGLDDASPTAANWIRAAFDTVADRALAANKLPKMHLEAFVRETHHAGHGRRLAFEWLVKADATARARLLPTMLADPGAELRREAVEIQLKAANELFLAKDEAAARTAYQKLADAARDHDQVKLIAERLDKLGSPVDLTSQLGYITRWALVGPFDNSKGAGFRTPHPPERGVDLKAEYEGKGGAKVRWVEHMANVKLGETDLKKLGLVDLNKVFHGEPGGDTERLREVVAFGYAVVESKQARPVDLRACSNNAIRIWLNGKEIFFREEYHHGMDVDQHVGKGTLKAGRNEILVKICQNHQDESWARLWSFQLRVCDAIGGAVPVSVVTDKLKSTSDGGQQ